MKSTEMFIIRTWDEFRELCKNDAYNWHESGYKSSEITAEDILNEYPEGSFITEYPDEDSIYDDQHIFTAEDIASATIVAMEEIEEEEAAANS